MPVQPYLTQMIHRAAHMRPDQLCTVCGDRRRTNDEFQKRVSLLAGALKGRLGVTVDERVSILALNSDRYIEAFFAIWWAGAVSNPINTRWSAAETVYALNDCRPSVLLVDDAFLPLVQALRSKVGSLRHVVHIGDEPTPVGLVHWEDLISAETLAEDVGRSGDDLAFVLYTGGTTGNPKGVALSHTNLVSASVGMLAAGCGTGEVYLHAPPLFHMAGIQMMIGHFLGGLGPHIVVEHFTPEAVLSAVQEHRATDVMLVPAMLQMVLTHPGIADYDLTSLRRIFYGAAPMTEVLLDKAADLVPGTGFVQGYGMTETALTIMLPPWFYTPEGRKQDKLRSIGRPLPMSEVVIRDPEGYEVARGGIGELTVKGPSVMIGYFGRPEQTAATVRSGWLYSGDGAYMDDGGFVYLVDRLKDMIITGGENVYSLEVENVLVVHPAVASAAVIGIPHETWGETVHAVVTLHAGASLTAEELIAHAKERIAGYKCPRSVEYRDALPLSAAGKILKSELRAEHQLTYSSEARVVSARDARPQGDSSLWILGRVRS